MRKQISYIILAVLLVQCSSIEKHNTQLSQTIAVDKLKKDVDVAQRKLQKMHPNLYYYISKNELDLKFDSVKKSITTPITSIDFYKKISPVFAAVRQGHMYVYRPTKKMTKKETAILTKKGTGPLSQFEFEFIDDKLYVVKNKSYDQSIKVGAEVLAVNSISPQFLFNEYKHRFTSDGLNTNFKPNFFAKRFGQFFSNEYGILDSISYSLKSNDSLKSVTIKRRIIDSSAIKRQRSKVALTTAEKEKIKSKKKNFKKNQSILGYDPVSKVFNRDLSFLEQDSSIAVLKIKSFSKGKYKKFYKQAFQRIQNNKSKTLIIDLRNNGGGRLNEIVDLYKYLADSTFVFLDESEVTSRASIISHYFYGGSILSKIPRILTAPLVVPIIALIVHKNQEGKYYFSNKTHPEKIRATAFKGKVYVLINGGSFSASSVISANLKGEKRAVFVGQETGGAHNGTVAGRMPIIELPNSKIKIRIGLMNTVPYHKSEIFGRGVFPDHEIIPTLNDRINNVDPEMNWVLEDCKKN